VLPFAPVSPVAPCGPAGPAGSVKQALNASVIIVAAIRFEYLMVIPSIWLTGSTHVIVSNPPDLISFWRE
jgi:hypothetical protein